MVVQFGLIGCGYISKKHIKALAESEGARLAAVSDLNIERMEEAKAYYKTWSKRNPSPKSYEDYHDMLWNPEIDAVIISTFSGLHAEMARVALEHGKHVVLEKPMALSIRESNQLINLAKNRKKELMICHQLRFKPVIQKLKKTIEEGKIGSPYLGVASIRINRPPAYYSAAAWRGKWESDGGMLINQGIHLIDLLQWLLGDVKTVYGETGQGQKQTKQTEDVALGILSFQNGAKGIVEANIVTQPNNLGYSLSIFGDKGTISIEGPSLNKITRWYVDGEETDMEELNSLLNDGQEHIDMYKNFIEAVSSKDSHVLVDGLEGKKALDIIFALYQSELTKQVIHFPLKSFTTKDMNRRDG